MTIRWRAEWPQLTIIMAMLIVAAVTWPSAPAQIPIHWNVAGEANAYGGKFVGLLLIPLLAMGVESALLLIPRIDPGGANYEQFYGAYAIMRFAIVAFIAGVYGLTQLAIRGHHVNMVETANVLIGVLFIVLGNLLGKVRPNWFVGIRTPWTLSSKLAWDRTHRLGGWLFAGAGVLMVMSIFMPITVSAALALGVAVALGLGLAIYSYFVWRGDPHKIPPAGTSPA